MSGEEPTPVAAGEAATPLAPVIGDGLVDCPVKFDLKTSRVREDVCPAISSPSSPPLPIATATAGPPGAAGAGAGAGAAGVLLL